MRRPPSSRLQFSRNIQEGGKTIVATQAELDGLPPDYLGRHQPDADGQITLTTDQPDMQPVMTFASSAALRERMFLAYNTRAYPANKQILLEQLLATRQEIATVLGFRSWADLATADQMMGSAANVRTFLAKLDEASRDGAVREVEQVLEFARSATARHLEAIDITSRGYWYEQFRRSAFDFDSQSVRPYFPYEQGRGRRAGDRGAPVQGRVPPLVGAGMGSGRFGLRSVRRRQAGGPVLSRHASARRQGQVVLRRAGGHGRARALPARGGAHLQFPRRRCRAIRACCSTTTWSRSSTNSAT